MTISLKSTLTLYPLTIKEDKKHYLVEESISGEFFEMPKVCIDAIKMMNNGFNLGQVQASLLQTYPKEEVDLLDFSHQLVELGLVQSIDGKIIEMKKENHKIRGFEWIPAKVGKLLFNRVTSKLYFLVFMMNILFLVLNPKLLPTYQDMFVFDVMIWNVLIYAVLSLILLLIHEMGHVLAIRSHNLPTNWNIAHRLMLVVMETDLTAAWKLPNHRRNILYLGGMCFDQVLLFTALSWKLTLPNDELILHGILSMIALDIFIKTIYQCCFYMKTDLYFVFENISGCYNLMENAKQHLREWLPFIKEDTTTTVYQEEKRTVRLYSYFFLCGIILTFSLFAFYFLPQAVYVYMNIIPQLLLPMNSVYFWDAIIILGQSLIILVLLFYSITKSKRL
ncbi:hypothetical protein [Gracilibacillus sp. JCM 18860]|uniref:hypothetical protein n=1 Tax=Gracilibacillus sp. JCM 18860 TaxID=1306159 RepID=UPI0006D0E06C